MTSFHNPSDLDRGINTDPWIAAEGNAYLISMPLFGQTHRWTLPSLMSALA